jgi:hypothetical protein
VCGSARGIGCAIAPVLPVVLALWEWSILLGRLGPAGALAWLVLFGLVTTLVARRARRSLRGVALGRARAAILLVATAVALALAGDLVGQVLHAWLQAPVQRLRAV